MVEIGELLMSWDVACLLKTVIGNSVEIEKDLSYHGAVNRTSIQISIVVVLA